MTAQTGGFWNLSNKLTLFRIGAIPIIAFLLLFLPDRWPSFVAAFIFLLAAISDGLDGYLARRGNMVSTMGKLLDPLADKLLVCTALIMLIPLGRVSAWIVAVIIGREMVVTTLRGVSAAGGVVIAANWSGKLKAFTQLVATNLLILHYSYFSLDIHLIGTILIWIALVLTVWSGIDFLLRYRKIT
ncbi:MAG: CDP-diacylglycerol--glycerol-3-phosphate 3-phosphatidyltransferase [Deltaproteobacteria bacterium RBG_16_54_11]|jgi:CDP-diacylglycerol--glycerol-3-phosphate 3-phosphatidyltransferase|nr:MAG: CDP-diacylglycerol--glycerol-3-phosphate 3-phosphatidyltransferase [Deltaproteobacteria bacterium RBG_16_54_11]